MASTNDNITGISDTPTSRNEVLFSSGSEVSRTRDAGDSGNVLSLLTAAIPANKLLPGDTLQIVVACSCTNNANAKAFTMKIGGSTIIDIDLTSQAGFEKRMNLYVASETKINHLVNSDVDGVGYGVITESTTGIDTTTAMDIEFFTDMGVNSDVMNVRGFDVELKRSVNIPHTEPEMPQSANPGTFDIASSTYSVGEGDGTFNVVVNRSSGSQGTATVDYDGGSITAVGAGVDYNSIQGTLTFLDSETTKNITVTIIDDSLRESPDETFSVTISNPTNGSILGSTTSTTVTIVDNEPAHEYILDDMTGFAAAAGTTGGAGGAVVTVTNNNDTGAGSLRQAVTDATGPTWINFVGLGTVTITQATQLKLDSIGNENITIDGRGADITIAGEGIRLRQDSATEFGNFIFLNIKCDTTLTDCIQLTNNINKIWIHNCDFTDSPDEYISLTSTLGTSYQAPRGVTVSYCQLDDGIKGILTGGEETQTIDTNIRLTQHHNFFNGVNERAPRMRFAKVHSYNNYHFNWTSSAMFSSQDGELYSDGDIFEDGVDTLVGSEDNGIRATIASGDLTTGYAAVVNSVHLAAATLHTDANIDSVAPFPNVFDPTSFYTVTPDDPTGDSGVALKADIAANAGWQNDAFPT